MEFRRIAPAQGIPGKEVFGETSVGLEYGPGKQRPHVQLLDPRLLENGLGQAETQH